MNGVGGMAEPVGSAGGSDGVVGGGSVARDWAAPWAVAARPSRLTDRQKLVMAGMDLASALRTLRELA